MNRVVDFLRPIGPAIIVKLDGFVLAVLYRFRDLYKPVERLLTGIVLVVVAAFTVNLFLARPDPASMLAGLVPSPPPGRFAAMLRPRADPDVTVLQALVATTFSVAGAFFQAYSVRTGAIPWQSYPDDRSRFHSWGQVRVVLAAGSLSPTSAPVPSKFRASRTSCAPAPGPPSRSSASSTSCPRHGCNRRGMSGP
jgi:hypothetical protein